MDQIGSVAPNVEQSLSFDEYEQLHFGFYRTLFIQLTLACPLECDHCCVNSGPKRREALSADVIERGIRSFAALPDAEVVCLTGGEPFVARRALHRALAVCQEVGLRAYVITAAHWAPTVTAASKVLDSLPPITLLSVSADRYHEKFVPLANVRNAIEAATRHRIAVNLLLTLDQDDDPYRSTVATALGGFWHEISIRVTYFQPVGRAQPEGIGCYPATEPLPMGLCPMIGTPAVTADGSISACCQAQETNLIVTGVPHALRLGYMGDTDFATARDTVRTDPLLRAIRNLGPGWVFMRALERGRDLGERRSFATICDVCSELVRNVKRADDLRGMLAEPSLKLQLDIAGRSSDGV
ncbi:radical SAM protein [Rhodopseudomonas sp. RCAM05734]|uniref:radical SAM protein n=1 Tax=Rhodopseudomonas sp. RCAM05734 TaxID=3457549 RepID=UPI0040450DF8